MAEAVKSNADVDLTQLSRDGANSSYVSKAPEDQDKDAGNAVQQVLGAPAKAGKKD